MKKILLLICIVLLQCVNAQNSSVLNNEMQKYNVEKYDIWFSDISNVRVGVINNEIMGLTNPFVYLTPKIDSNNQNSTKKPAQTLVLNAIMEGKYAMINNSWHEVKSLVNGLILTKIKEGSVILSGTNKSIELFLRKKNENSIIKTN
ncbi:MAG: hypothetical protein ACK5LP_02575 [Campylobacteraceae bacterium]